MNAVYRGCRHSSGCDVTVERNGKTMPLPWRLDLAEHSPTGLTWGYAGSGPHQLALALLADAVGKKAALNLYDRFTVEIVAHLPYEGWELSAETVRGWAQRQQAERVVTS